MLDKQKASKKWKDDWVEVKTLGSGGQGTVKLVKQHRVVNNNLFVLKELKSQKDEERRARMRREYIALETLNHDSIPKVFYSNTQEYKDLDYKLYFIMEYIEGNTLENYVKQNGILNLQDAADLTIKLLEIIDYCHQQNIIHRDIKPDNIVLRNGSLLEPVVVDFGQSFNAEDENYYQTHDEQTLGNRFLALPELVENSNNKREILSDITMICGILFYCLTGIEPRQLIYSCNSMPHQKHKDKFNLSSVNSYQTSILYDIFDRGFQYIPYMRYQSTKALIFDLNQLKSVKLLNQIDMQLDIENIKKALHAPERQRLNALRELFNKIDRDIESARNRVLSIFINDIERLQDLLINSHSRCNYLAKGISGRVLGLRDKIGLFQIPYLLIAVRIIGDEIILSARAQSGCTFDENMLNDCETLMRFPVAEYQLSNSNQKLVDTIKDYIQNEVYNSIHTANKT